MFKKYRVTLVRVACVCGKSSSTCAQDEKWLVVVFDRDASGRRLLYEICLVSKVSRHPKPNTRGIRKSLKRYLQTPAPTRTRPHLSDSVMRIYDTPSGRRARFRQFIVHRNSIMGQDCVHVRAR